MKKQKIGIIGATGYTGSELVRLLAFHPSVQIEAISSERYAGKRFSDVHPSFHQIVDTPLIPLEELLQLDLDLVFLALPHGVSMDVVKKMAGKNTRIVDLSGDFRLNDTETYESWYGKTHVYPEGFKTAAYGMPELFAEQVKEAPLVANPGCYPTASILALAPLIRAKAVQIGSIIIDAKSGTTGAGAKAKPVNHFSTVNDNFKAYGLKTHRHTIEIQQILGKDQEEEPILQFTPHLLPIDRGILATIYARPTKEFEPANLYKLYRDFYADHPFVRIVDAPPTLKQVRASNYCDLFVTYDERTDNILIISAIDNLIKGAAGQAVHNMNLMLGLPQTEGLQAIPLHP